MKQKYNIADTKYKAVLHATKWIDKFQKEFERESDRAAVIISANMLHQALKDLIKAFLVESPNQKDRLFDKDNSLFSSFGHSIEMAYRLGLISISFRNDLHKIKKIRNEFAHHPTRKSFRFKKTREYVSKLEVPNVIKDIFPKMKDHFPKSTRLRFQTGVSWMMFWITFHSKRVTHLSKSQEFNFSTLIEKQ